jgi:hypothetical protein
VHRVIVLLTLPLLVACEQEPKLSLAEPVKQIASKCHEIATQQSGGFDPRTAEESRRPRATYSTRRSMMAESCFRLRHSSATST